jgi:hypothetical protein
MLPASVPVFSFSCATFRLRPFSPGQRRYRRSRMSCRSNEGETLQFPLQ